MQNLISKRFVVRKSLIGKQVKYNHDKVYDIMKSKLESMPCFEKYKSYTSSTSIPVILRDKVIL